MSNQFQELAAQYKDEIVQTASEMLQINSQSTQEGDFAQYVAEQNEGPGL